MKTKMRRFPDPTMEQSLLGKEVRPTTVLYHCVAAFNNISLNCYWPSQSKDEFLFSLNGMALPFRSQREHSRTSTWSSWQFSTISATHPSCLVTFSCCESQLRDNERKLYGRVPIVKNFRERYGAQCSGDDRVV